MRLKKIIIVLIILPLLFLNRNYPDWVLGQEISPSPVSPTPELTLEPTPTLEINPVPPEDITPTSQLTFSPTPEPSSEISPTSSLELTPTPEPEEFFNLPPLPEAPNLNQEESETLPGVVEGEGSEFKLEKDGLVKVVKSTASIKGLFESTIGGVVLNFESADGSQATILTITGLLPNHNYHLYTDDLHNHREVFSDSEGNLVFTQDISTHHLLIIQPLTSTKYIRNDTTGGNCTSIGIWNNATKTCTLTTDVFETIQIDGSGVTLDGNGHKVDPPLGTSNGIYFKTGITGVTVKNIKVYKASYGVYLYQASNNLIENIENRGNNNYGIYVSSGSNGNTIKNSTFAESQIGVNVYRSGNNTFLNNTFSANTSYGVYVYSSSNGNIFTNNKIVENFRGIWIDNSNSNIFTSNIIARSYNTSEEGIYVRSGSNNNQFKDNIIYKNGPYGIRFYNYDSACSGNVFEHNLISDHSMYGIYGRSRGANIYKNNVILGNSNTGIIIGDSSNNLVEGNFVSGSSYYGIYILSGNNTIAKNILVNNKSGIYLQGSSGNTISGNILRNNTSLGINLSGSQNNVVKFNYLTNNNYGLFVSSSANNNQIYNNNFIANNTQVYVSSSTGNVFNLASPTGGNYWSNWTTPDSNNDGFVDNPYVFPNGLDNLPWAKINGWAGGFLTTDNAPSTWQNGNIEITLTCKDKNNNNCDQTFYRINGGDWQTGNSFVVETEGFNLIEYYSVHQGITEESKFTYALIDKTPPVISGAPTKPAYWNSWYNQPVTIHFTAYDDLSGIQTPLDDVTLSSDGGNQSVSRTATDRVGNSATATVSGINIDLTPPVTTANFSGEHGSGNWYKSDVLVSLSAADTSSGVKKTEYSFDGANWQEYTGPFTLNSEGLNKFYYRSTDNVDNVENVSKTQTTVFSHDLKNYNASDWPDPTYLPGFSGRPQNFSTCGIMFAGQPWYYGYCLYGEENPPNAGKRRAIGYYQPFTLTADTRLDFAAIPRFGTDGTTPFEIFLYDTASNNYVRIAAREIGFYNRTVQTEISGFGTRESGNLWADGVWLLFRLESKDNKVKISVLDTNENVLWSTIYNVNLRDLISTYRLSMGSFSEAGQTYKVSYNPIADDIKIFDTIWVFKSSDVNIDKTPPSIEASFSGNQGANQWYTSDVTAVLTANDNNEIDRIEYSNDGLNWNNYSSPVVLTSSGEFTFYYRAFDLAGNSASGSQNLKIDKIPPTTSIVLNGEQGNDDWYKSDVLVTLLAVDNEGGMDEGKTEYRLNSANWQEYTEPVNITTEGITTFEYRSIDSAGNQEGTKKELIKIDKTPPTITGKRTPAPNDYNWNKEDVVVSFTCEDGQSGIESCTPETTVSTEGVAQFVQGLAQDKAGNTATFTVSGINIDKTPPQIVNILMPEPNANGWYNTNVVISYSCADSISGPLKTQDSKEISSEGKNQSQSLVCEDLAGNSQTETKGGINIDKTPPQIIITTPQNQTYLLNQQVLANWQVNDGLSGIENYTATTSNGQPIDTSFVGSHSFEVNAKDYAGNSNSMTVSYSVGYVFGGILPPINSDGTSLFKLGRTIPVKFKLFDANNIEISNAIAYLNIAKVSNNVLGTEEEAVSTSQATEGNLFRYDLVEKQYIFNLNTKTMSTGTWALIIYLNDGSTKSVWISLK